MNTAAAQPGRTVQVLIGQVHLTRPPHRLVTVLGSCVGLVVHDFTTRLTGMAHILLPESRGRRVVGMPGRHADEAIRCLIDALAEFDVPRARLKAWIAGGATMFADPSLPPAAAAVPGVGAANVNAVRRGLCAHRIPVIADAVGGPHGRRMSFDPARARMEIRVLDHLQAAAALAKPPSQTSPTPPQPATGALSP